MREPSKTRNAPALGYLAGTYPAVSHTFILREVRGLRERGFRIETASIDYPEWGGAGSGRAEAEETAGTFYVKRRGAMRILWDQAACFVRRPLRYLGGLGYGLRLAGLDLRDVVSHVGYFVEAVVVGRWMEGEGLEHLHVHFANASATVALLAGRVYGIGYSITVHGSDEFYGLAYYRVAEKVAGAQFAVCIGQQCRSQVMKGSAAEDWEKLEVCRLGVDPEVFAPREVGRGERLEVLCVARLVAAKGQSVLLAAAAQLVERGWDIHVSLVGDGPGRGRFEGEAERLRLGGRVTFHGSITQERIGEYLGRADVFVLPSFAEGIPVTLMEAMAMEVACVSTQVGGIGELIETGENGLLVPASDVDGLAAAIERLLADAELRGRLGRAGRRTVVERYNLRENIAAKAAVFERRLG